LDAIIMKASNWCVFSRMGFVLRRPHSRGRRFTLTHICTTLGVSVIVCAAEVIDPRFEIHPHNGVQRTMTFRLCFSSKLPNTSRCTC